MKFIKLSISLLTILSSCTVNDKSLDNLNNAQSFLDNIITNPEKAKSLLHDDFSFAWQCGLFAINNTFLVNFSGIDCLWFFRLGGIWCWSVLRMNKTFVTKDYTNFYLFLLLIYSIRSIFIIKLWYFKVFICPLRKIALKVFY